ncbi:MAG: hypothetical protein P8X46_13945 [Nitrospirales bacterium]
MLQFQSRMWPRRLNGTPPVLTVASILTRPDANKFGDLVTHRDGLHSVYITDAFGNSIEVLEEP